MNRPAHPIQADDFLAALRNRTASGEYTVAIDGGELPALVQLRDSPALVFSFSGAVDRAEHPLPRFSATTLHEYVSASVIALADPSLALSDNLKLAWYAGHEGLALQKLLPDFIRQMIESLDATRVAFVGTSGGGFAALYYSWQSPGSIALVSNPQTSLNHAIREHRNRYRAACWPSLAEDTPLNAAIDLDLGSLYSTRCDNTVIYLQQASDFYHLKWHFAPFVASLTREYSHRLVVRMASWGERGHQPVPSNIWIPWMRAALTAEEPTAASIEETWTRENPARTRPLKPLSPAHQRPPALKRDNQIAAELARTATAALLGPHAPEQQSS